MSSLRLTIIQHFQEGLREREATLAKCAGAIEDAARLMIATVAGGGTIYLFGNGGSAADAQHIEAELTGRYLKDRPAINARAITTNPSATTAIANDYGYDQLFARHMQFAKPGDVAIGISTSGKSPNVIFGLKEAKLRGARTIGLTGAGGAVLAEYSDVCIAVASTFTPRIQELHIAVGHVLCQLVEDAIRHEQGGVS